MQICGDMILWELIYLGAKFKILKYSISYYSSFMLSAGYKNQTWTYTVIQYSMMKCNINYSIVFVFQYYLKNGFFDKIIHDLNVNWTGKAVITTTDKSLHLRATLQNTSWKISLENFSLAVFFAHTFRVVSDRVLIVEHYGRFWLSRAIRAIASRCASPNWESDA